MDFILGKITAGKDFENADLQVQMKWQTGDIPDQTGKIALVTGGNSGLGYESVKALARKNASVVLTSRDMGKGEAARKRIIEGWPGARIEVIPLDLASLASIRQFAGVIHEKYDQLNILINNAGVMATPKSETADGFELQFGTNHLGHFALTGWLLELVLATPQSRVVTVSSLGEWFFPINFSDLMGRRFYYRWIAYCQSKLANLLFAYELQRRLAGAGVHPISLAAHPGFTSTNLRAKLLSPETPLFQRMVGAFGELISRSSAEMGALPQLYAATAPAVSGGEYYGPDGFLQLSGYPRQVRSSRRSHDRETARRLWEISETLTGIWYKVSNRK
jgi:protochlorophyllide reductase